MSADVSVTPTISANAFLQDVINGLSRGVDKKRIPSRYLYDEQGCELFEKICTLPEYYPTRTELEIMSRDADSMAEVCGEGCTLIELGSGSSTKTRLLLDALRRPAMYVPVDIAPEYLEPSVRSLSTDYPALEIEPVCADFTEPFDLPERTAGGRQVIYFPGSTIGNFHREDAISLLRSMKQTCTRTGGILIGMDLKKDPELLEAAYDDEQGVTSAFSLNILNRMRRELDAWIDVDQFEHVSRYNPDEGRIEIYLCSTEGQMIQLGDHTFELAPGELINTEYSYKYSLDEVVELAVNAGCVMTHAWLDRRNWFGVFFFDFSPA